MIAYGGLYQLGTSCDVVTGTISWSLLQHLLPLPAGTRFVGSVQQPGAAGPGEPATFLMQTSAAIAPKVWVEVSFYLKML